MGASIEYLNNPRKEAIENDLKVDNKCFLDLGLKPTTGESDFVKNIYQVYESNIVKGSPCLEARVENNPIKMPYPPPPSVGSIFENQKEVLGRSFGE